MNKAFVVFITALILFSVLSANGLGVASVAEPGSSSYKGNGDYSRNKRIVVTARIAYVRESPDFNSPVKHRLIRGEVADVITTKNGWFNIIWNVSNTGWVYRSYVTFKGFERKGLPLPVAEGGDTVPDTPEDLRRISVNFINTDIREALSAIALEQELNIATAQEVKGNVSVHLFNVFLEDALDALTMTGGYAFKHVHGMYYIYKPKDHKDLLGESLETRVFKIRYIEIEKIKDILEAIPGIRTIEVHETSGTVIVEDTPSNIRKIESIVSRWDVSPRQVMIEAKIMEVALNDDMAFGVNWTKFFKDGAVGTGGFSSGVLPDGTPVSPVPSDGAGFFGNLLTGAGTDHQFSLALDALKTETNVETLSTPKILAIHGKAAKVQVGGQQGYKVTTTNQGIATESIEFINTGTILEITPYIQEDGTVLLSVNPSINSAVIEQGVPVVSSTTVSTWLLANSGETVFIGGLIQDRKSETRQKIPFLGDIPIFGRLFGRTVKGAGKTELVVFITPRVQPEAAGE